ncbi:hypothetical protein L3X38_035278 [Prunus dulcis]|uniref:RNase H type-1 domain-containing protein n=1 Tax=Prunus dulcis TaxID=3755 RepID=A0AAD4VJD7_PRUDU|nr:hypothetical protein L3X38_035278 [Prunus dulcis]
MFGTQISIHFQFKAFNNEAKYESLLIGLWLARDMPAQQTSIYIDSQLVVNEITTEFATKHTSMIAYLSQAHLSHEIRHGNFIPKKFILHPLASSWCLPQVWLRSGILDLFDFDYFWLSPWYYLCHLHPHQVILQQFLW